MVRCQKIRQKCGFTQKVALCTYNFGYFPTVVRILVGRLDLCFRIHTKKYMTPIHMHALILQNMSKCVFILEVSKSRFNFITLLGKYVQHKKVG